MRCPYCSHARDRVVDSRSANENRSVRRRRECLKCRRRFTTYESLEEVPIMVVKRDGRREAFDRNKIATGILKACEKRTVSMKQVEAVVDRIEKEIHKNADREVDASLIGEMVMRELHKVDEVAYIRFASVYRQFKDIGEFMTELKDLLKR